MATDKGVVTAHVNRLTQNKDYIVTMQFTEKQVLELISMLTVGLREKAMYDDEGYRVALRNVRVRKCQAVPPCEGGELSLTLVRPGKRAAKPKA